MGDVMALAIISVSHCWATSEHPDPVGTTLVRVADVIERAISENSEWDPGKQGLKHSGFPKDWAVFFDCEHICLRRCARCARLCHRRSYPRVGRVRAVPKG